MRETDGRKLSHETLEAMRIRAVKAVESGESPERVIRTLGLSRPRIYEWLAAFREGGGRRFGRSRSVVDHASWMHARCAGFSRR